VPQADPDLWVTVRPHPRGPCLMSIARAFRVIGLDQVFSSYDTVDDAARALSS
jgi:hypothetical protein